MTPTVAPPAPGTAVPDHTQLPDKDGTIVTNFQEAPQSALLTDSLLPVLRQRHPDGHFAIGRDCGIYWRPADPPLLGCRAPDWFYVPDVPPTLEGQFRRSYVLWQEIEAPLIVVEYVSGDGSEERDRTPMRGKFWVYERGIRVPYYGIYEFASGRLSVFQLVNGRYEPLPPNERGHHPIAPLGVELGVWRGVFENVEATWLRWWDSEGNLLPTSAEQVERERSQAERERQAKEEARLQAEYERQEKQRLAERLRSLGVDPSVT